MFDILANRVYRTLLSAQIVALLGTGLATVALALLAFELAADNAGAVLGTALFIKMIAYVGLAPLAGALAAVFPRKVLLIVLDLIRAGIVLLLPFVDQVWQVYVLIFVLQSASAIFTPTFQATIPDILSDERDYTRALSLSRLAYDLENLLSPAIAALLLLVISFNSLFAGTSIGFLISMVLIARVTLPRIEQTAKPQSFGDKITRGIKIYLATPRLRGLLALNLSVAAAGAMVIVNTVVIVRQLLQRSESELGLAMAAFGAGSMVAALSLPLLLDRLRDRRVMLTAASFLGLLMIGFSAAFENLAAAQLWSALLITWLLLGLCYGMILTPTGRLLKRSAHDEDRPSVFAAQFALSHACWLVTYPLAGWLGASAGMPVTLATLAVIVLCGVVIATLVWPYEETANLPHSHPELPPDHPHLKHHQAQGLHRHPVIIDDLHPHWPQKGL